MRCIIVAVLLCATALGAAPERNVSKLTGWTYHTSALPLSEQYADPGARLTDGKAGSKAQKAIWRGRTLTFDLDLRGPCELSSIRIYLHRHNLNYRLDHLSVLVRRGAEWREIARRKGFFGPTPSMNFVFDMNLGDARADAVRLIFAGARVLSLSEIEIFGRRASETKKPAGPFARVPFDTTGNTVAREKDLDGDGAAEVILENATVRLIFSPSFGGVCRSLVYKPTGEELVFAQEKGYGLFRDQLWKPKYTFGDRLYFHRVSRSADSASVELWTTGVGGMMSFTQVRKRVTIFRKSPIIRVHYALENEPSSQTNCEYGFWSHNWLGVLGKTNTYFFPTTDGVCSFTLDPSKVKHAGEAWMRNPARGWTAFVSGSGTGLAMEIPYRYLNLFYYWYGAGSLAATHEWRFNLITIKPGERLEIEFALIPFHGLTRVDGVVDDLVGEIDARVAKGQVSATARIYAPPGVPKTRAKIVAIPAGSNETREIVQADLDTGRINEIRTRSFPVREPGSVLRVILVRNGNVLGSFERPVFVGKERFAYTLEPECARVGRAEEETASAPGHEISTSVDTPHIPWARPLAGGKIRALVLMDDMNCREPVELAERIDMDLDYVKFRTTFDKTWRYQGDQSILTLEAGRKALLAKLEARKYDLIVLAGFNWNFHFTPSIHDAILGQVRKGAGLILVQPDGFTKEQAAKRPFAGVAKKGEAARRMRMWFQWRRASDSPLVTGLDWSLFPVTRRHEYDVPPRGRVVAVSGSDNAPLIVLNTFGKGRVVSITWDTLTHAMSYRGYSGLTPILSYRGGWLRPEFAALPKGYHEWWFALLTRLAAWAAGRDTGVAIVDAPPVSASLDSLGSTRVRIKVRSARALPNAVVDARWFNHLGDEIAATKTPVRLERGDSTISIPLPLTLQAGRNTVDFVIRNESRASLGWGFTSIQLDAPTAISSMDVTPATILPKGGVWQKDTPVETCAFEPSKPVKAQIQLTSPSEKPLLCEFTLTDCRGRLLAKAVRDIPKGSRKTSATFPPLTLVHQGIEVAAKLRDGGRVVAAARKRIVAYRPRVWKRFWYTSWGGQYLWRTKYLFDFNNRLVRDFGVDVSFWGSSELSTGKVRDNAYWDVNHSWLGLLDYMGRGVPGFRDKQFSFKAAQYAKTHDKKYLIRTPSLTDPKWREAVRRHVIEATRSVAFEGGAYDYCMGDEMSLTYYTRFLDFDWSPSSLAGFRKWLRKKYKSLDALNAAWDTRFKRWDDVLPMTREEAKKAGNPAPWFEFRTYMNDQVAEFFAFVQKSIRSVDPHARCGLSGTQSPEAANGMDWWKMCHAFSYFHSYNTSWSCEMRRSFQKSGGTDQSPYFSGYSAVDPHAENRMFWCLFHDTRGISAWKTGLFFYGDFSMTPSGRDTARHLREFRRGLWRLIRGAERLNDRIAIYYSMPSIIAGALDGEERQVNAARDAWVKIIEDSGLQYEFVAYEQVADGLLTRDGFKVLIMPYTLAISPAESKAIHDFVSRGGTVIATRPVAVRDDIGRPQKPGLLDDLFGVEVSGGPQSVKPAVVLKQAAGTLKAGETIRVPVAATNVKVTTGRALAESASGAVPAVIVGPGERAVLLNFDLTYYEQERRSHSATERQVRAIVLDIFAKAGVGPAVRLKMASGKAPHVEVVRYALDDLQYLCLLNNDDEPDVATIDLGREVNVYDVRAGASRGTLRTLTVPLDPLCARVYCLAPSPLPAPTISAPPAARRAVDEEGDIRRGGFISFTVSRHAPARAPQLIRITVKDAAGRERSWLMQTIWVQVQDRPVKSSLPLALNDPPGLWTLTATDVTSGRESEAKVEVR